MYVALETGSDVKSGALGTMEMAGEGNVLLVCMTTAMSMTVLKA